MRQHMHCTLLQCLSKTYHFKIDAIYALNYRAYHLILQNVYLAGPHLAHTNIFVY